ncbi:unnamed protein product [Mytilus coruscus]|uniref:Uncharacterized protein n=1 Tax=Mytilus coruscus TaxID=42192 RepID=A0A6J8CG71_MYTCO|nr:unnamed protein product [Mytilus coruscus]
MSMTGHYHKHCFISGPVLQKSIYQKLFEYFGPPKYIHPDLYVVFEGENLGVVTYTGSGSKSEIKISLPENTLLQHFTQTQNKTELQALIGNVTTVAKNKGRRGSNQIPNLQSANKSCQTNTDNMCKLLFEILKMQQWPDCNNTKDGYSSIKDTSFQERDPCILFYWKSNLYSPSTVRKMIKENHYEGENFDIILISEGERQLRIENLSDVVISTAFEVAKSLQNLKDGRLVKKLKEVLHPLESRAEGIQIINVNKPSSTQQKRKTKENNNSRTNFINKPEKQRTKSIKTGNIDEQYCLSKLEEYYNIVQEEKPIMKNQHKNDLSITDNYFVKPLLERSAPKIPSHRVVPTKMKNSKVKTQINHPE